MTGGVKGTAIESLVADVRRLVEAGRLTSEQLEVRLEAADLELLEAKLLPSAWYGLGSYGRLMELLLAVEGGGRIDYLVERGRRAAERIRRAGLYAQLAVERERWGSRVGQLMVTLGPAMYKDTTWRFELIEVGEGARFRIEGDVPACFPDVCRHATQGFIEQIACHTTERAMCVTSERPAPIRMVFHGGPR